MDLLGNEIHDAGLAGQGETTGLLHEEGHGGSLVEKAELAVLVLLVGGVAEDASVEKSAVDISNHGSDVAGRVLGSTLSLAGLDGSDVVLEGLVPVPSVGLVHRVDLSALGQHDVGVGEHKLANGAIIGEAVDSSSDGEDKHAGRGVEAVAGGHERISRLEGVQEAGALDAVIIDHAVLHALRLLVDAKDGAGRDVGVDVGGAVEGIEDSDILAADVDGNILVLALSSRDLVRVLVEHGDVLLLRGDDADLAGEAKSALEHVVGDHIELLLLLSLNVDRSSSVGIADHSGDGGAVNQVGDGLASLLDATDERLEVAELRVSAGNLHHVAGEGNAGLLADFVEHWGADSPLLDVGHHDGRGASNSDGGTAGLRQAERPPGESNRRRSQERRRA
mmetsp:Transcript_6783/g.15659  ORF Transcript_6783/g.15659 Transcript_6783/m.15659 type:complete len:392 (+) Transcript_6783:190-1365(+)